MSNRILTDETKVSAFNKNQYQPESEVLFNPLLLIHATCCKTFKTNISNEKDAFNFNLYFTISFEFSKYGNDRLDNK